MRRMNSLCLYLQQSQEAHQDNQEQSQNHHQSNPQRKEPLSRSQRWLN